MPSEAVRPGRCPQCGRPRVAEYRPFCSRGCRDRDLLGWFGERYRVPVVGEPDGGDDASTADEDRG